MTVSVQPKDKTQDQDHGAGCADNGHQCLISYIITAANARLEVSRSGNTLTCVMTGLDNVVGNVVWLKDHQYFPKQDFTPNITLTSDDYKRLSDDISNRYDLTSHQRIDTNLQ